MAEIAAALAKTTRTPKGLGRAYADPLGSGTSGSFLDGITVTIPTVGSGARLAVVVPAPCLAKNAVFGTVIGGAIPRTQGPLVDQHRKVLLLLARDFGDPKLSANIRDARHRLNKSENLSGTVQRLRDRAGLPASDLARMVGIQRRQFYNLMTGGSTTPEREQRIRTIGDIVNTLFDRLNRDPSLVRSALLAPIGSDMESFVDLAAEGEPVSDASEILLRYLAERNDAIRTYIQTPRRARDQQVSAAEEIKRILDIAPDEHR